MKTIIIYNKTEGNVENVISTDLLYRENSVEGVLKLLLPLLNDSQDAVYTEFEHADIRPSKISVTDSGEVIILEEKTYN